MGYMRKLKNNLNSPNKGYETGPRAMKWRIRKQQGKNTLF